MGSRRGVALLVVGGLLLVLVWALWPTRRPGPVPAGAPAAAPTVVFLGDSITHGHRLPRNVAFPYRVGQALGVNAVNAGISGDTTAGGLARLERDVIARRPRLVVVALGVNDMLGRLPGERSLQNLRTITRRVRAQGAEVILLHVTLPGIPGDGHRRAFREIARTEGATLVEDFLEGVVPDHTYDGLHPDEQGQAMLADRLAPVIRKALGRA